MKFGYFFNKKVNRLPSTITHLEFGDSFNQPIDNLPSGITHLKLGKHFDKAIKSIPTSITHLVLRDNRPEFINGLSDSVIHLTLNKYYKFCHLPAFITYLKIREKYDEYISLSDKYLTFVKRCPNKTIFQVSNDLSWTNYIAWLRQQSVFKLTDLSHVSRKKISHCAEQCIYKIGSMVEIIGSHAEPYISPFIDPMIHYAEPFVDPMFHYAGPYIRKLVEIIDYYTEFN